MQHYAEIILFSEVSFIEFCCGQTAFILYLIVSHCLLLWVADSLGVASPGGLTLLRDVVLVDFRHQQAMIFQEDGDDWTRGSI